MYLNAKTSVKLNKTISILNLSCSLAGFESNVIEWNFLADNTGLVDIGARAFATPMLDPEMQWTTNLTRGPVKNN